MLERFTLRLVVSAALCCTIAGCSTAFYYCHEQSEIDEAEQRVLQTLSLEMGDRILSGDVKSVREHLSEQTRESTSADQLNTLLQSVSAGGPYTNVRIDRMMAIRRVGLSNSGTSVTVCSKDLKHVENNVTLSAKNIDEQAYVTVSADGAAEKWKILLWLVPEGKDWRVQGLYVTITTALKKSSGEILNQARAERATGHSINAELLYVLAATLANNGPSYRTGLQDLIDSEQKQVMLPVEFRGDAPYTLRGTGGPFVLLRFSPVTVDGQLYVVLVQQVEAWKDSAEVERTNQALIRQFAKTFPEYAEVFGGIVAEADERGSTRGWRTVLPNSKIPAAR